MARPRARAVLKDQIDNLDLTKRLTVHDSRLFRRLMTGFFLLDDDYIVDPVLKQITINPDDRLTRSACIYLRLFPYDKRISIEILDFFKSSVNLFEHKEARLLELLRYSYKNTLKIQRYANKIYGNKKKHWYVRCQAVNIMADAIVKTKSFDKIVTMFEKEINPEVKRTLLKLVCQLDSKRQHDILINAVYNPHYKIANLGKMLLRLRHRRNRAVEELTYIFRDYTEDKLRDNFYKLGVIRYNNDKYVLDKLTEYLSRIRLPFHSKYLKLKRKAILDEVAYIQLKLGFSK